MNESQLKELLSIPGAKRASQGVILPTKDGGFFHIINVHHQRTLDGLTENETFFVAFCSRSEILRLRELRGAHDYLLRLRANAIVDSPRVVRVMTARKNSFEASGRSWNLTHYYHSKDEYHKSYLRNLKREHAKALKGIPAGLALIPEANALCIRSLAGDVVVASEYLEHFFYFMSIAFYGNQLGIKPIDQSDALLIAIRIMTGAEAQDFDIDPRGKLGHELERTIKKLVMSQMMFTFGHEYAHLLCDHLALPEIQVKEESYDKSVDLAKDLRIYNHDLEHEADFFALNNIKHDKDTYQIVAQGGFSVLIYLHFLQEIGGLCGLKKFSVSQTHPNPRDRIIALHRRLAKASPLKKEDIDGIFLASEKMSEMLNQRLKYKTRDDIFSFYGSVYLSSFTSKVKSDRYDF